MKTSRLAAFASLHAIVLTLLCCTLPAEAQINKVILQDDFASNTIDPSRYTPDAPFFEGGRGDIHATAHNGVIEFVGTTTQQWWSGATLQVAPTITVTEQTPVTFSIDRVSEAGVGSASRSALWILDETKTFYVLFADVRGEQGWRFNRKIGETGDVATGGGTIMTTFDGGTYDDGGLHRMQMIANGSTVKLLLDGQQGAEVAFPFEKVLFEFGSYARATNDTASTTWDNLLIEQALPTTVVLQDDFSSNAINPSRYTPDAPFFEGGRGDIHATAHDGVIEFVGTTTQQWWSGATLRISPSFTATDETPVALSIDRVSEAGVGTASRSALWILDESRAFYVLFADVRGEQGWRFNRKIGETGDVATGGGTIMTAFDGASYDDGGLHRMQMIANGSTVKLLLDGQQGAEVAFPFSKVIFEFGAYARATNDTASTTWDNLKIETVVPQTSIVFQDDFESNAIDPARYEPDAPFFEGGQGDIHATAHDGVIEFVGTTTQQWWSGGTLRIVPTFAPSEAEVITLEIDRVAEAGVGTASRSALWILDETRTFYVLFADVRGEQGWRYNRKIGETGDVATGGGTIMTAFDGPTFDDGGLHRMSMIADGQTVKLLLDGQQGAEVSFPFSPVIFEFGSYARANNDTASTTWDNLVIKSAGGVTFTQTSIGVRRGQTSGEVSVRIPQGLNSQRDVQVTVSSNDPDIAIPEGGANGELTLTFPTGGANTTSFRVRGVAEGGTVFTLQSAGLGSGNELGVAVVGDPGVQLEEDFAAAAINTAKWQTSNVPFETATGSYTITQTAGQLEILGTSDSDFWSGVSLKSAESYVATRDLNLSVEVDRVDIQAFGSAARTGIFLTTADRSQFVFFGQNYLESWWEVNVNPGNPTGTGTSLAAFSDPVLQQAPDNHRLKMVANGSTVEVFLDGVSGGRFPFEVSSGIHVEIGAYARATADGVFAHFDNVKIENVVPCISFENPAVSMTEADLPASAGLNVPALLHDAAPVTLTITSQNPAVAIPTGAVNGSLTLTVQPGDPDLQTISVTPVGRGTTTFTVTSNPSHCSAGSLSVEVVAVPEVLLSDNFAGSTIDSAKWIQDAAAFDNITPGTATADSTISIVNGQVRIHVVAETLNWPGLALYTTETFSAGPTTPLTFEIDRVDLTFVLVGGTGALQRTGVWIKDSSTGFYVFFSDIAAHNTTLGWRYNQFIGAPNDSPVGNGVNIQAFDGRVFDDLGPHRMKLIANGSTVELYLDGVLGAEVPFPVSQNITFGFGTYVNLSNAALDIGTGFFDNVKISGGEGVAPARLSVAFQNGSLVISWTAPGTLEESSTLANGSWTAVTPPPTGNSATIPISGQAKFYRVRQ